MTRIVSIDALAIPFPEGESYDPALQHQLQIAHARFAFEVED